jgi:hypothetical protein
MNISWLIKGYPYFFKRTSPGATDRVYSVDDVWVNTSTDVAYILVSVIDGVASWVVRNPDSIINAGTGGEIRVIGETATGAGMGTDPDAIHSHPGAGEYKVTSVKMDSAEKIVVTYEDTPR